MLYLITFLFLLIPVAAITFFIVSLCLFLSARKKNKRQPGSVNEQILKERRIMVIISSITAGVVVAIVIGFIVLMSMAVMYM